MKGAIVAALVGSAVAASHKAHAGFHLRRNGAYPVEEGVCQTVTTTVYVTASAPTAPAYTSSVVVVPAPVPETSTSCTEEEHSSSAAYTPAPVPEAPTSSTEEHPSSTAFTPAPVPETSTSCTEEEHPSSAAYTAAPVPSTTEKPVVPSSVYVPVAPAPSSPAGYVPPKPSSYHAAPPAFTSKAAPKPSTPSTPSYGAGTWNKPNGQKWAITYTPYTKGGDCKSQMDVNNDIATIANLGYVAIRVYSTDCGVFENVIPATQKHSMQVIYGIFLDATSAPGSQGANEQLQDIIDNAPKDTVSMLIVGNEYISGHGGDAGSLASYVAAVKTKWVAAGFTAPVTTTETVAAWEQYGSVLCDVIDIFAAQVQPYFDGGKTASEAGDFAYSQLEQAAKVCPEAAAKGKFISEIGWPAGGSPNGVAIPGKAEQKEAMQSIIEKLGDHACIFSYQNDNWKSPGAYNVEQFFGCADNL
ncbi:beta-glucosidase btgE [Paraphaeosphaeria minitans]|uniref:Probable beta-glucosidase btgE n=1 Tax=Paraphaeosphaeria minitans TaxID=565426 RepID=A0A9P6KR28_9PLEO|nr:beta-glucosidase btgE [Paraphaeosphaeria minitans]